MYGLLNTSYVQNYTKNLIVKELTKKLDTELGISKLRFLPYNTIELDSVYILDQSNDKILFANRISTSIDIFALLQKKLVFTQASLIDFDVILSKESKTEPLNIQFIIDAFKPKDNKPKEKISVQLNSITIKDGRFNYDILDAPYLTAKFDPNHIQVSDLVAKLSLKSLVTDSLNIQIKRLGLNEKSGFKISDLSGRLLSQDKSYYIKDFLLLLPNSKLEFNQLDFSLDDKTSSNTIAATAISSINFDLKKSEIDPVDIAAFLPQITKIKDKISIETKLMAKRNDLQLDNLNVDFGKGFKFEANGNIKNYYLEDTSIDFNVSKLALTGKELDEIVNLFSMNQVNLPQGIDDLKNILFVGSLKGPLNKIDAIGNLYTDNGNLLTKFLIGFDKETKRVIDLNGYVKSTDFELGKTLNNNKLNKVSLDVHLSLKNKGDNNISSKLFGDIYNFDFNGYSFQNINFDIKHNPKVTDISLNIDDEYVDLALLANYDQTNKNRPSLKGNVILKNLELSKTKLAGKKFDNANLALNVEIDVKGKNFNQLEGVVHIDSVSFYRNNEELFLKHFDLEAKQIDDINKEITLKSDIVSGYLRGVYNFNSLVNNFKTVVSYYADNLNLKHTKTNLKNEFDFEIVVNNTEQLSRVLELPVSVLERGKVNGSFNSDRNYINLDVDFPRIFAANNYFKDNKISLNTTSKELKLDVNSTFINKNKVTNLLSLKNEISNNTIHTFIELRNDHRNKIDLGLHLDTELDYDKRLKSYLVDVNIRDSNIKINNETWILDNSLIRYNKNYTSVEGFSLHTKDYNQSLSINGQYSKKDPNTQLKVLLKSLDLEYLFETLAIDALQFGGLASGNFNVSSIEEKPYVMANLNVNHFKFNNTELGDLELSSHLEQGSNKILLDGMIINPENKRTLIKGMIDPVQSNLSIDFDADSINIGFLNKYTASILNNVTGRGSGQVRLHGNFSKVTVSGVADIIDGKIGVKLLDAEYTFSDKIYLKDNLIYFNDIKLHDKMGNVAEGSGKVSHEHFSNMAYYIGLKTDNFLVYNSSETNNPIFYGIVFGKGSAAIHGNEQKINIEVKMETQPNTKVSMNFMDESVTYYPFIKFKQKDEEVELDEIDQVFNKQTLMQPIKTNSEMAVNMDFFISATPDATFNLIMDPEGGDALRGYGRGDLQFKWDTKTSPQLFGIFNVLKGNYNFRFQRLLEKNFKIKEGSTIDFKGDPFKAVLNIAAIYELYASLSDLDNDLVKTTGKTNVLTNCLLNIKGELQRPNITLDIEFPKESENIQSQIKSYMNTVDMINKQVAYLLLLSKFYTPETSTVDNPSSDWAVVASATLSSQLTNIINHLDKRIQLGTHIRMGDPELSNTEVELLLSSQLLDDRLLINGNFGYRRNEMINQDAVITDIDIEFLLNKRGTWRLKAFNHYNEKFFYLNSEKGIQTQGIGIIYRKNFDNLSDLFGRKKKKKDEPLPAPVEN